MVFIEIQVDSLAMAGFQRAFRVRRWRRIGEGVEDRRPDVSFVSPTIVRQVLYGGFRVSPVWPRPSGGAGVH